MHKSVLLNESIDSLNIKKDGIYIDCTLGLGGHSARVLEKLDEGFLCCFDQDVDAIEIADSKLKKIGTNYEIIKSNFVNLKEELEKRNIKKVDGILFDLGVSSMQLDQKERGFSYRQDAELDMRMDKSSDKDAKKIVNTYEEQELVKIFYEYGEEKYSKSIAKNIVKARKEKEINTTLELVEIIKNSVPYSYKEKKHPARKVFQALRIEVNDELNVLKKALIDSIGLLKIDGVLAVITFHSLEDKIVKKTFIEYSKIAERVKGMPNIPLEYQPVLEIENKKIKPSKTEIEENNRSRSAILRVAKKRREK